LKKSWETAFREAYIKMSKSGIYDVIVVGAGHAGVEAASAAARMGCDTLLITIKKDNLGELSCNPAVGGLGKGQLVKEVDALGGVIGKAADFSGIHFKRLNMSKGPAVRSSRAQVDRKLYKEFISKFVSSHKNLETKEGVAASIIIENGAAAGVELEKEQVYGKTVIITPGTFLNGTIHIGLRNFPGGRMGEKNSTRLSESFKKAGFRMMRFKTGTCARLDGKTIDFSELQEQHPDDPPVPFSFLTDKISNNQKLCHITYTNEETHRIIREGFDRSPLFTGVIEGTGVRYCPSIEDKLVKFSEMKRHHVFLEPESLSDDQYYPNGISTSLPEDVQDKFIRTIKGLENVKINIYGYGIEHDVVDPTELFPTLETKKVRNLFLAGQINGTTGYEEAAAQGLMAGINAAAKIQNKDPLVFRRHEAYIGVLIDDLVTKGTNEPYRMFTSRAEYRLMLREDNAHLRLTETGNNYGVVRKELFRKVDRFQKSLADMRKKIQNITIDDNAENKSRFGSRVPCNLYELLKIPEVKIDDLPDLIPELKKFDSAVAEELEIQIKYEGYINRQLREISRMESTEDLRLPKDLDYKSIGGLSNEIVEKLEKVRPLTLGQAARISGVTPAAVTSIMIFLKGKRNA